MRYANNITQQKHAFDVILFTDAKIFASISLLLFWVAARGSGFDLFLSPLLRYSATVLGLRHGYRYRDRLLTGARDVRRRRRREECLVPDCEAARVPMSKRRRRISRDVAWRGARRRVVGARGELRELEGVHGTRGSA